MYCIADVLFGCLLHSSLYYFAMAHLTDALHSSLYRDEMKNK